MSNTWRQQEKARGRTEGYEAALAGKHIQTNPYPPNHSNFAQWIQGYHAGREVEEAEHLCPACARPIFEDVPADIVALRNEIQTEIASVKATIARWQAADQQRAAEWIKGYEEERRRAETAECELAATRERLAKRDNDQLETQKMFVITRTELRAAERRLAQCQEALRLIAEDWETDVQGIVDCRLIEKARELAQEPLVYDYKKDEQ